jgi:hypothetical protein
MMADNSAAPSAFKPVHLINVSHLIGYLLSPHVSLQRFQTVGVDTYG